MKISSNFNRLYRGAFINDIYKNYKGTLQAKFMGENVLVNLNMLSAKSIHNILKQITNYPKDDKGIAISSKFIEPKDMVNHLEEIRVLMSENGFTFQIDNEEYQRLIDEAMRCGID